MFLLNLAIGVFSGFAAMLPFIIVFQIFENKQNGQISMGHNFGVYVFAILISGILTVTGVPSLATYTVDFNLNLIPFVDILSNSVQYVQNVILFIPLGFMLPLLWDAYKSAKKTILCGFLFSLAIEAIQVLSFRATDVDDLLMNTLGAAIGYFVFMGLQKYFPKFLKCFCFKTAQEGESSVLVKNEVKIYFTIFWLTAFFIQNGISSFLWGVVI